MASPNTALVVHVVRVFADDHDDHGNPLGVVLAGDLVPDPADRQELAFELGFSETVFLDDRARGALQIFTPSLELPLAGHPLVGTAWLLAHVGSPVATLRPPAGEVACGADAAGAWFTADPAWAPAWRLTQVGSAGAVDDLDAGAAGGWAYAWAWIDEAAGLVRARSFVREHGNHDEDEATGSAAMRLCAELGRPLTIHQGRGSVIHARPAGHLVHISGRVIFDEELTVG